MFQGQEEYQERSNSANCNLDRQQMTRPDAINAKLKPDLTHKESTSTVQNPKI